MPQHYRYGITETVPVEGSRLTRSRGLLHDRDDRAPRKQAIPAADVQAARQVQCVP